MENKTKNDVMGYNCILRKIKHKPIIVEYLFSFIKDKPYKFLNLIEKDTILKESLNSTFNFSLKGNKFSKELNDNICLIKIYKKIQEYCRNLKNKDDIYSPDKFENYLFKNLCINKESVYSFLLEGKYTKLIFSYFIVS